MINDISPIPHPPETQQQLQQHSGSTATRVEVYDRVDPFAAIGDSPFASPNPNNNNHNNNIKALDGAAAAANDEDDNAKSTDAAQLSNIVYQVQVLRDDIAQLEDRQKGLEQEAQFAEQEESRIRVLLSQTVQELEAVSSTVEALTREREEHHCVPDPADYQTAERLLKYIRATELRLADKEQHVSSVLAEVARINAEVSAQKKAAAAEGGSPNRKGITSAEEATTIAMAAAAEDAAAAAELNEEQVYLLQLAHCVEEQRMEIEKFEAAQDDTRQLESETTDNEAAIRQLREKIENIGVAVPEASMTHRLRRFEQNNLRVNAAQGEEGILRSSQQTAALSGLNTSSNGANDSLLQSLQHTTHDTLLTKRHDQKQRRTLGLPVGVLPLLNRQLGCPPRQVATRQCGLTSFAVHCTDLETYMACEGTPGALDKFESIVRQAMFRVFRLSKGIVTYADAGLAEAATQAADRLNDLMGTKK